MPNARALPIKPLPAGRRSARVATLAALLFAASAAQAQYKVVGPDGKVTYTDRAPSPSLGRVVPLKAKPVDEPADSGLPFELRQVAAKYPVTLYTLAGNCEPCAAARQLLRQRGVPYNERLVASAEDGDALERLTGARDAPSLTIGGQALRGLTPDVWNSYLDAANYPRESRLPAGYAYRAPSPLVERRDEAAPRSVAAPTRIPLPTPTAPPSAAGSGIRF